MLASSFLALGRVSADAADDYGTEDQVVDVLACFARTFFQVLARIANESRSGDAGGEKTVTDAAGHFLHDRPGAGDIDGRKFGSGVSNGVLRWEGSGKDLALILRWAAPQDALVGLHAFPHPRGRA